MSDTANGTTLGWKFTYSLSERIDCDKDVHGMEDVEFVTHVDKKQNRITGFSITVHLQERTDAKLKANHMALRLVSLLVASSGTHSTHRLDGYGEIKTSGKMKVVKRLTFRYQIRNNAIVNMDPETFRGLLNSNTDLAERIRFIAHALQASKIKDHSSVIKHLVMACNEEPTGIWKKFKHLRNALSHNKDPLFSDTIDGLKEFGPDYFTLTGDGKFDFESASNLRHLEFHAGEFLTHMHTCLKNELEEMK